MWNSCSFSDIRVKNFSFNAAMNNLIYHFIHLQNKFSKDGILAEKLNVFSILINIDKLLSHFKQEETALERWDGLITVT